MEESASDVGGLQIRKRPGDKDEQEDKHTFRAPEPRRSILGAYTGYNMHIVVY